MADSLFGRLKGSLDQAKDMAVKSVENLPTSMEQTKDFVGKGVDMSKNLTAQSIEALSNSVEQAKIAANKGIDLAKEDLQANGTWSYKTEQISMLELEQLEAKLNELGKQRWELTHLIENEQHLVLILKKPNIGYIANTVQIATGRNL